MFIKVSASGQSDTPDRIHPGVVVITKSSAGWREVRVTKLLDREKPMFAGMLLKEGNVEMRNPESTFAWGYLDEVTSVRRYDDYDETPVNVE